MEKPDPAIRIERVTTLTQPQQAQLNDILDEPWDATQGQKFLQNPDNTLFLAFAEDTVVGFLTGYRLQRLDKNRAEVLLYEVEVVEAFRQRGIGKRLIAALNAWAAEVGAFQSWVLTYSNNPAAMALYKSMDGEEDPPGTRMFTYYLD